MIWRERYADKLVSAQEAASHIRSGDTVLSTMFSSVPYALIEELGARCPELENVNIYMGFGGGLYTPLDKSCNGHVNVVSLFYGPAERAFKYKLESNIGFQVLQLSQSYDDRINYHRGDVVMMAATPPDEDGNMSFGMVPIDTEYCLNARDVIVQINENVPYIKGADNMINIKDVTCAVDMTEPLFTVDQNDPNEDELKIADLIAERIPDGACLQFGIGGLSTAMGSRCVDKKHLGIHTEMFVESMADLVECGAVDNSMKQIDKGISTFGFAMGSERLSEFLNNNPLCESRCFSYSNDPYMIAKNDRVYSINSAMQVDITGQVASEGIGFVQHSGIGGQLDYVRGAQMSKGGHSFIALSSTHTNRKGETSSKIVIGHPMGTPITTPRAEVEYIVTEYGIADLKYQTLEERAKRLIAIAHPDFRDELTFEAKKLGLLY